MRAEKRQPSGWSVLTRREAPCERRRRDSNPRYPVERYNTLAGCRLQPLGHSSGWGQYIKDVRRVRAEVCQGYLSLVSSIISSSTTSGLVFAGSASRICCPETSSLILTSVALRVAPKRMVREEMQRYRRRIITVPIEP